MSKKLQEKSNQSHCPTCEELREALVKITQMNCPTKKDITKMIAEIREIAREAVPDYIERARALRQKSKNNDKTD